MSKHHRSAEKGNQPRRAKILEPAVPGNLADRRWQLLQHELPHHWSCLNNEDVLRIAGNRDELLTVLHEKYSYTRTVAEKELNAALAGKVKKP